MFAAELSDEMGKLTLPVHEALDGVQAIVI